MCVYKHYLTWTHGYKEIEHGYKEIEHGYKEFEHGRENLDFQGQIIFFPCARMKCRQFQVRKVYALVIRKVHAHYEFLKLIELHTP